MFFVVLCVYFIFPVQSEVSPPQNVQVDGGLLTWTSAPRNSSFTVLQRSLWKNNWENFSPCFRINVTSCDVMSITGEGGPKCAQLAVQEETQEQKSEACSTQGGACTPAVQLLGSPGSLTVQLSRNHSLIYEYADHIKYRVYFGKEGAPLQLLEDNAYASVDIPQLEEGRSYCASAQFTYFGEPVGLTRCAVCKRVPKTKVNVGGIVSGVLVVLFVLAAFAVYFILYQRMRIKKCLRLPYHIPCDAMDRPQVLVNSNSSEEECFDKISSIDTI